MILPIVAYGHPTLKAIAQPITPDYPELETLVKDMWETLAHSEGVGCHLFLYYSLYIILR